ncbi:MAG: riboflavin synthase [Gammaproteobacteria bacterium]|nr:riboflavin synthase [Gammaproteobacteria bacterium]
MFTGIISHVGVITLIPNSINNKKAGTVKIMVPIDFTQGSNCLNLGDSIAVNGVCLTVTEFGENYFTVEISEETVEKTIFQYINYGQIVNLEKSLKFGDNLNGHLVSGHVDTVIKVASIEEIADHKKIVFNLNINQTQEYLKYIAVKGSVTINGVSLTVNQIDFKKGNITVNIVPYTLACTNLNNLKVNNYVNLEIDMFARYIANYLQMTKLNLLNIEA